MLRVYSYCIVLLSGKGLKVGVGLSESKYTLRANAYSEYTIKYESVLKS